MVCDAYNTESRPEVCDHHSHKEHHGRHGAFVTILFLIICGLILASWRIKRYLREREMAGYIEHTDASFRYS